jgi:hypothetical protein
MKVHVEKQLSDVRQELRSLSTFTNAQSISDRQKLLVAVMQEVRLLLATLLWHCIAALFIGYRS